MDAKPSSCCGRLLARSCRRRRSGEEHFGIAGTHGNHGAAGGKIRALKNFVPGFATVGGFVNSAIFAVAPELSGNAGENSVAVLGVDENFGDALGVVKTHVGPVFA